MKKRHSIPFALAMAMTMQTTGQVGLVFRTNLTDIVVGRYSVGVEALISDQYSLGLDVDCILKDVFLSSDHPWYSGGVTVKKGIVLEPQFRWYPAKVAGQGMYSSVSGFFGYASYSPMDEGSWGAIPPPEWMAGGLSLHLGHQLRIRRFILDTYLGVTWTKNKEMGFYYEDLPLFPQPSGLRMSGGLRVGVCAVES